MRLLREYIRKYLELKEVTGKVVYKGAPTTSIGGLSTSVSLTGGGAFSGSFENDDQDDDSLLVEPDDPSEKSEDADLEQEASVAAAVAGVTTPLGTGPTYPDRPKKKKKKRR